MKVSLSSDKGSFEMELCPDSKQALCEAVRRMEVIEQSEPPSYRWFDRPRWEEQIEYGPRYAVSTWFGSVDEAQRQRYRRSLNKLAELGLLQLTTYGGRLSNVKPTEEGRRVAKSFTSMEA
jgi:hypothetical protein